MPVQVRPSALLILDRRFQNLDFGRNSETETSEKSNMRLRNNFNRTQKNADFTDIHGLLSVLIR